MAAEALRGLSSFSGALQRHSRLRETPGVADEAQLLAWFDRHGYDVHLEELDQVWSAAATLKIQPVGAGAAESGKTRVAALEHLQARLIADRGLQP